MLGGVGCGFVPGRSLTPGKGVGLDSSLSKLEKLKVQEAQLKARIQLEQNRISAQARKERTGKLVAWGVAVEQLLADGSIKEDWWRMQCARVLSGRTLERASVDEVKGDKQAD